ncbi:MAG: hypothetical protein H7249_06440 [Chitinophagaceae bacterium]|nr:hypothetical protein [Oligoflexus sp.]
MKVLFLSALVVATAFIGCKSKQSVAGAYAAKLAAEGSADSSGAVDDGSGSGATDGTTTDETTTDGTATDGTTTDGTTTDGTTASTGTTPSTAGSTAGDAAKGATLLQSCTGCHTGAPGLTVLNKTAVPKLTTAETGAQKATHSALPAFSAANRADLTAGLNAK